MPRTFTLEEADALLPRVRSTFLSTSQLVGGARRIARALAEAGVLAETPGQLPSYAAVRHRPELRDLLERAEGLLELAAKEAHALAEAGVLVRDLERGLVDFPSVMDGEREVYLCWQLGEAKVSHWHDVHAGFVGRQPVRGHRFFRARQLRPPPE